MRSCAACCYPAIMFLTRCIFILQRTWMRIHRPVYFTADYGHGCKVTYLSRLFYSRLYTWMLRLLSYFPVYCVKTTKRRTADDYDDDFDSTGQYCKNNGVCYFYICTISYCTYQCLGCFCKNLQTILIFGASNR